MIMIDVILV